MRTRSSLLVIAALTGCVPQGQYDKIAQDALHSQAQAREEQRRREADDAQVQQLNARLVEAQASRQDCDRHLSDSLTSGKRLQASLDEATAQNAQLREELQRLGKNADALLAEKGALSSTLADARTRLEELHKAQAAAEARIALLRELASKFHKMIDAGELQVGLRDGRMVLQLSNDVLFDTGHTEIKPPGQAALREIASVLSTMRERHFQVAGHTDNVPIDNVRFPSNWELSAGRALEVVHFLVGKGMAPTSLSAAGYGEFDPVASNDDARGRARNRRTEITLQPEIEELVAVPGEDDAPGRK